MKKTSEYRRRAEECRAMALKARTGEHQAELLTMAETWDSLAEERETMLVRQSELSGAEPDGDSV